MNFRFTQITSAHNLLSIKDMYIDGFPPNERREFDALKNQLQLPESQILKILCDEATVGFISLWDFGSFVFVEHFTIIPALRGQGLGKAALMMLLKSKQKHYVLEVEPPSGAESIRRINFYRKLGFRLMDFDYRQPSYDGIKPEVNLKLMTTNPDVGNEWLICCVDIIREKVYQPFW